MLLRNADWQKSSWLDCRDCDWLFGAFVLEQVGRYSASFDQRRDARGVAVLSRTSDKFIASAVNGPLEQTANSY
jgi:hypothetical protein